MEGFILFRWVRPCSGRKSQRLSSKTFGGKQIPCFCPQIEQNKESSKIGKRYSFCIRDIMEREGIINLAKVFHRFYWIPAKANRLIPERNLEKIPS